MVVCRTRPVQVRLEEDPRPPGSAAPLLPLGTEGVPSVARTPGLRARG